MLLGLLFDTVGRRIPTLIGFSVSAISLFGTPWFKEVYPGFLCMRVLLGMGYVPGLNNPLLPDYLQSDSLGLATAYVIFNA